MATVPLAAPTTGDDRLARIGRHAEGFVYCVAVAGVTGGETAVDDDLRDFMARARREIAAPLAIGFGVRTPAQAAAIGALADGVVMASALVRLVEEAPDPAAAEVALDRLAGEVRAALEGVPAAAG